MANKQATTSDVHLTVDIERATRTRVGVDFIQTDTGTPSARTRRAADARSTSLGAALTEMRKLSRVGQMLRPARLVAALLGSAALVVPMLIMAIHPSQTKSIVTSCCFILAFSLGAALVATGTPGEVLAMTAAYSAVLVVFVGVNTES
ncbi:hypothetical protein N658DRAFT_510080 [Parathielavia hyrcaniae]|uniref:DUF6594 domain-containing protein n=1 Tax=Parathielavia hyrcaniae TaxID=113614 RepID=A0AAN6PTU0_9PEZI|nr:hypothetical protein N658DRAFT_510080 [Parathielavia hyrcaniae]